MIWPLALLNGILLAIAGLKFRHRHITFQAVYAVISMLIILIIAIQLWPLFGNLLILPLGVGLIVEIFLLLKYL